MISQFFPKIIATLHLEVKIQAKKSQKKTNKIFDISRASLCGTPVYLLQHTSVPRHSGWEPLHYTNAIPERIKFVS